MSNKIFSFQELIVISEYVRVASQSTPDKKTKDIIQEYLDIKEQRVLKMKLKWWNFLSSDKKLLFYAFCAGTFYDGTFNGELPNDLTDNQIVDIYNMVKYGY